MRHPLLRLPRLRDLESCALAACAPGELMARAASATATAALRMARALPRATPVAALIGPGNNGGDALLAVMHLRAIGIPAHPWFLDERAPVPADAAAARDRWLAGGGPIEPLERLRDALAAAPTTLIVDGLFGIGLRRPIQGVAARTIDAIVHGGHPVLAVDLPSGLDANRGTIVGGADGCVLPAARTLSFLADKAGLRTGLGPAVAGKVIIDDLGVRVDAQPDDGELLDETLAASLVRPRPRVSHKGSFGAVLVLGGEPGMRGAALLAASAAQAAGAGKTWVAAPGGDAFSPVQPQLMSRPFDGDSGGAAAVVIGCGLGRSTRAAQRLARVIADALPCVIDADALSLIAAEPALGHGLASRRTAAVLTPHPLEAARLLGCDVATVQADRVAQARELALRMRAIVLLKGAGTVIACHDGRWAVNTTGSAALAVGGSGDVLAGLIGGLLAQGYAAWDAARLGVWLHGHAGDLWHREHPHGAGLDPARLAEGIPAAWPHRDDTRAVL
jgi:hydroxyethylthiazole kinase-like uncharacterized protein yjeF